MRRLVWIPIGLVCVGIGGIGVVVPGLPSTGFFVLAAAAFARSSPRLEAWLLDLPGVGPLVRDYRAGLGMPRSAKVTAIAGEFQPGDPLDRDAQATARFAAARRGPRLQSADGTLHAGHAQLRYSSGRT